MDATSRSAVELRPARAGDIPTVADLVREAEAHDGVPRVLADEELAEDLGAPHVELGSDARVAVCDGAIVGWAYVWNPPAEHGIDRADLYGEVAPAHRGRGVGRELLGWSITRARHRMADRTHHLPRVVRVNAYDWLDDRACLYRRLGFTVVRWHDELIRPLDEVPRRPTPRGVTLLPWPDDRDDELRGVRNAAFADHWGSTVIEAEQWTILTRGHGARSDLSVIAVDGSSGAVLGLCMNQAYPEDEAVTGRRDAWIANVATLAAARGRGIASAMIARSLTAFAEAGFSHAVLDVDADNPTGAGRLYRALGFERHLRSVTHQIEIDHPTAR